MTTERVTRFLRLPVVIALVGKSRTAIYRDIQAGVFRHLFGLVRAR